MKNQSPIMFLFCLLIVSGISSCTRDVHRIYSYKNSFGAQGATIDKEAPYYYHTILFGTSKSYYTQQPAFALLLPTGDTIFSKSIDTNYISKYSKRIHFPYTLEMSSSIDDPGSAIVIKSPKSYQWSKETIVYENLEYQFTFFFEENVLAGVRINAPLKEWGMTPTQIKISNGEAKIFYPLPLKEDRLFELFGQPEKIKCDYETRMMH